MPVNTTGPTLNIFGDEYSNVKGFKAFDTNGDLVTFAKASGGSMIQVAKGTYTGNGTSYVVTLNVGTKFPQTSFYFRMKAQPNSVFTVGSKLQYVEIFYMCLPGVCKYDLSSYGDHHPEAASPITKTYNEETTTSNYGSDPINRIFYLGTGGSVSGQAINQRKVTKNANNFDLYVGLSDGSYAFANGIVYDWEIVYFGDNPSTDIVEVEPA